MRACCVKGFLKMLRKIKFTEERECTIDHVQKVKCLQVCSRGRCGQPCSRVLCPAPLNALSVSCMCRSCVLAESLQHFSPYRSPLFSRCACAECSWSVLSWLHERWSDLNWSHFSPVSSVFLSWWISFLSLSLFGLHYFGLALSSCPCWAMQPPPRKVRKCPSLHVRMKWRSALVCLFVWVIVHLVGIFFLGRAHFWLYLTLFLFDHFDGALMAQHWWDVCYWKSILLSLWRHFL